jgi:hypothetical protein
LGKKAANQVVEQREVSSMQSSSDIICESNHVVSSGHIKVVPIHDVGARAKECLKPAADGLDKL